MISVSEESDLIFNLHFLELYLNHIKYNSFIFFVIFFILKTINFSKIIIFLIMNFFKIIFLLQPLFLFVKFFFFKNHN